MQPSAQGEVKPAPLAPLLEAGQWHVHAVNRINGIDTRPQER